jgi:hypothetical protein
VKLVTFESSDGPRFGSVVGDSVVDLTTAIPGCPTIRDILAADRLDDLRRGQQDRGPTFSLHDLARVSGLVRS